MKDQNEIKEKINELNEKIEGMNSQKEELSNELKVILAGSELQALMLQTVLNKDENKVKDLIKMFEDRAIELTEKYEKASEKPSSRGDKQEIHAMIWTNDIRLDSLKWVLEEETNN